MTKPPHAKVYANDAERVAAGADGNARIDRLERRISIVGDVSPELERKLLEIADKCPVHRMLALPNAMTFTPVAGSVDSCDAPKQPLELIIRASPSGRKLTLVKIANPQTMGQCRWPSQARTSGDANA